MLEIFSAGWDLVLLKFLEGSVQLDESLKLAILFCYVGHKYFLLIYSRIILYLN